MTRKTLVLLAAGCLALGFLTVVLVRGLLHTDAEWERQMAGDTETALAIFAEIRAGSLPVDLSGEDALWRRWDAGMDLYDAARRAELGERLRAYVAFMEAEYADAAVVYRNGDLPQTTSDAALEAREEVRRRLGGLAEHLIRDADALREEAYRCSPAHSGIDPDLPDFVDERERVRTWAGVVRELIDRMVEDPDKRTGR